MTKLLMLPEPLESRRQYGIFSDFLDEGARLCQTYRLADVAADADLAATVIFQPGRAITVHNVYIMPDGSATGIDDSNTSVWTVTNGTTNLVSKTYNTTNAFPADSVQDSLGTIAVPTIAATGRIELAVTNGTTANTVATEVTIVYSPLVGFPERGWSMVATDGGTASISDAVKGVLAMTPSDATAGDNDEVYVHSTTELFKFLDGKPIIAESKVQFSEANTDDANVAFGLANAPAADLLVDNGAGLRTTGDILAIYKVDGGTAWKVVSSCNSTQTISTSTTTAGGSSYQTLRIEARPVANAQDVFEVSFFVDDAVLLDSTTLKPIKHRVDYSTSPTEMSLFLGCKNGGTNAETLNVDYAGAWQLR